ncbi:hypothetical protein [Azospirillum agricola]|uniref:hypothetical protein n=1 Tax=Azospirillum agricola TaxID=1720247 RepID=UPI000A0EF44B|nr:hypothetical protein [Azospirillum agricola]SMH55993.1 hypothetical protein SAMN02982994_3957 [Azospirillum lipoferum]
MRSPFRPLLSALFAVLVAAGSPLAPALAQESGKAAPRAAAPAKPAKPTQSKTMQGSPMAQVRFGEPAYLLTDDGTYRDYMGRIMAEYGRRCVRQEQFGWELAKDDQTRLDRIFQGTMIGFGRTGYLVGEVKPKAVVDPETIVFLADREKRRLLMVWVPMETSVLLMMCDTDAAAPKKP